MTAARFRAKPKAAGRTRVRRPAAPELPEPVETEVGGAAPMVRIDATPKLEGTARYVADLRPAGMLHAALAFSDEPHAWLEGVDVSEAWRMPGVVAVVTGLEARADPLGGVPLLAGDRVRWRGERLAVVAATSVDEARAAAAAVRARYRALPALLSLDDATAPAAHPLHDEPAPVARLVRGNTERALASSAVRIEERYELDAQQDAPLEPQGVLVIPDESGGVSVYGPLLDPWAVQRRVATVLDVPEGLVRVVPAVTGGGGQARLSTGAELAGCAALLSRRTNLPVRLVLDREEHLRIAARRPRMVVTHTLGADETGTLTAARVRAVVDLGAWPLDGGIEVHELCAHVLGPYRMPNADVEIRGVFTCNVPAAGGGTAMALVHEAQMDALAHELGRTPEDVRRINLVDRPRRGAHKRATPGPARLMEAALRAIDVERTREEHHRLRTGGARVVRGLGIACVHQGLGLHALQQSREQVGALVHVHHDGTASFCAGVVEHGQGIATMLTALVANAFGIPMSSVVPLPADTRMVPDSGPSRRSRSVVVAGSAVQAACATIRADMDVVAAQTLGCRPAQLVYAHGKVMGPRGKSMAFVDVVTRCAEQKTPLSASARSAGPLGLKEPFAMHASAAHIAEVELDVCTGRARVLRMVCAHDVGNVLFHAGVIGSIEGGVMRGVGSALLEHSPEGSGEDEARGYRDYAIPSAGDAPAIRFILAEDEHDEHRRHSKKGTMEGPLGAHGVGSTVPMTAAAAIHNAIAAALGAAPNALPCSAERVMELLQRQGLDPFG